MRSRADHTTDRRLAMLARRLGIDRNPLRRGTDRVEAALRLVMILLMVVAVPAAAIAAGRWADHYALHRAQLQRAVDHQVTAVLLEDAPAVGIPDPYTSVQTVNSNPMLRYASACLWEIAPVPIMPTFKLVPPCRNYAV